MTEHNKNEKVLELSDQILNNPQQLAKGDAKPRDLILISLAVNNYCRPYVVDAFNESASRYFKQYVYDKYRIQVRDHKTKQQYGECNVGVYAEMRRAMELYLLYLRPTPSEGNERYFFLTNTEGSMLPSILLNGIKAHSARMNISQEMQKSIVTLKRM